MVFSTNKTDRHDITEMLLKVALNTVRKGCGAGDFIKEDMNVNILYGKDKICCIRLSDIFPTYILSVVYGLSRLFLYSYNDCVKSVTTLLKSFSK